MGTLKLTYYQREEALEKNSLFVVGGLEKNALAQKKRVRTYRYGFNGMEKDDEVAGAGNSLDFGARIYDPRLGRWLALDPLMLDFPHESPYSFAGSNPVYFVDKDGKKKTTYIKIIDKDGNTRKIVLVDEKKVKSLVVGSMYKGDFSLDKIYFTQDYDINEYVTINGGVIKSGGEILGKERNWYTGMGEWVDENIATGGIVMTSSTGEGGAPEGLGDGRELNIDDLISLIGIAHSAANSKNPVVSGQAKEFLEIITALIDAGEAGENLSKAFELANKAQKQRASNCAYCAAREARIAKENEEAKANEEAKTASSQKESKSAEQEEAGDDESSSESGSESSEDE